MTPIQNLKQHKIMVYKENQKKKAVLLNALYCKFSILVQKHYHTA